MRITILTYLESEENKTYDGVVDQVAAALTRAGHQTSVLGVHGDLRKLHTGLARRRPDLVFNLMEMFGKSVAGDVTVAGVRSSLGLPYTGGGHGELFLQSDKALAKKILAIDDIAYPNFAVFDRQSGDLETGGNLRNGHVVNYGYRLFESPAWIRHFGAITQPYLEESARNVSALSPPRR